MNTATRAANGLWSVACLLVTFSLLGLFVYWVCIQQPPRLAVDNYNPVQHSVTPGSIIYFEAPMSSSEGAVGMTFRGQLVQRGEVKYILPSPDSVPREELQHSSEKIISGAPEYPLYALYVPSYVKPGDYVYMVQVTYRLNPFKTKTTDLPPINISVQ